MALLRVAGLSGRRGDNRLFSDLNFDLHNGDALQIVGANGVGKTTLLRILAGLGRQESGTAILSLDDCCNTRVYDYRRRILYIGHNLGLNLRLNPVENLIWWVSLCANEEFLQSSTEAEVRQLCEDALFLVGLFEHQLLSCADLSAGQKRRVALARLFLSARAIEHRKVWILDEPFTSLDAEFSDRVVVQIQNHCDRGGGVIFTSHQDMSELSQNSLLLGGSLTGELAAG